MVPINDGKIGKPEPEDLFTIPGVDTKFGDQFFFGVDSNTGTSVLYLQKDPKKSANRGATDEPIKIGFFNPARFGGDTKLVGSTSGVIGPRGLQSPFVFNQNENSTGTTPFIGGISQRTLRQASLSIIDNPNIIGGNDDGSDPSIKFGDVFNTTELFDAFTDAVGGNADGSPVFLKEEAINAAQRICESDPSNIPDVGCRKSSEILTEVGGTDGLLPFEVQRLLNVTPTGEPTGRIEFGRFDDELGVLDPGLSVRERNRSNSFANGGVLKYPLYDISDFGYDYLFLQRYKVTEGSPTNKPGNASTKIYLPMQPNLEEENGVNWGVDTLNTLQARLVDSAIDKMTAAEKADGLGQALQNMASSLGLSAANIAKDAVGMSDKLLEASIAYFAGQAVGANVLTRSTGMVINPNMELLFNEPQLRTFNFNFTFTPRFEAEANVIRSIIREFKSAMAPKAKPPYFFLYSPDVFVLEYRYNNQKHPFMHKFKKRCALTSFSVNYTPSNSYMTYKSNGSMTQYSVSMAFSELEPTYESDQVGGTGT